MQSPITDPIDAGRSRLLVISFLIAFFAVLLMVLRIAQQNYIMALGALWVANALTGILHTVYWGRHGVSGGFKAAIVFQLLLTVAPLFFGNLGIALVFLMLGGEVHYW
ncbi:hypothetical protein [Pseudomonas sp. MWU318]|uniref:hypothetical protein n=1 Tax=Pseudomonas sp. MWU318 TaxID=2802569 RepID=UPI00192940C5|nr:hypothetical protein [Pseudomonas sp. MWU318]